MDFMVNGPFQIINSDHSKLENTAKGHQWPKQELIKYAAYLSFSAKPKNGEPSIDYNSWPFFRKLSMFVQSKNPNQCRIFHKKMMADHSSVHSLIAQLKTTIHKFQEWEQHYESSLLNLQTCLNRERDEARKQLTKKTMTNKQSLKLVEQKDWEIKSERRQSKSELEDLKKNEDLIPTDCTYKQEAKETHSDFDTFSQRPKNTRKSFDSSLLQEKNVGQDFSMFNRQPRSQGLTNPAVNPFSSMNMDWAGCHSTFVSYMSKLKSLMGNSQDY